MPRFQSRSVLLDSLSNRAAGWYVWPALCAGALLIALAERYAACHPYGVAHFHLFWLGMGLAYLSIGWRLGLASLSPARRSTLLLALAAFDALPKWLRSPDHLLFYDELAHWRQAEVTIATGRLFAPNPTVPIIQDYPGLHALTAALHACCGLTSYQVALVLLVALHVAALFGVAALADAVWHDARVSDLAALLYSLNPGFLYFDAMFAYESLAIVLLIWSLVAIAHAADPAGGAWRRAWAGLALLFGAACIVTHHLSSYLLMGIYLLMVLCAVWRTRFRSAAGAELRPLGAVAGILALGIACWTVLAARGVVAYLGPEARQVLHDLSLLFGAPARHRALFAASTTPGYERLAALLAPAVAAVGSLAALPMVRRLRVAPCAVGLGLLVLGALYFASFPLLLTAGGNEAARRSWSFTYLGLAVILALPATALLRWADGRRPAPRALIRLTLVGCCGVLLVGNVAMNTNETYRFPGAMIFGSDTRTLTAELLDTVAWFRATEGTGQPVIAGRDDGLAFASFGGDWTASGWSGLPIWQLYLTTAAPSQGLLRALQGAHYQYLVIDARMARYLPRIGYYVSREEPLSQIRTSPPPAEALRRYERLPWASKIYSSDDLAIYRLDYAALRRVWSPAATG